MEAETKFTYVGIAVLALVAGLVAAVVWLKRTGAERDFARYTIYFQEQALDGLAVGASVDMRGITIGRVLNFGLTYGNVNRVRVGVRLDRNAPVRENTVAVITRNFITGIAQITLVTTEPAGPALEQAAAGEDYPVIPEGRSDLTEIAGRVNQLGDMASETLNNLNRLLTSENRGAFAETLRNLRDVSQSLKAGLAGLDQTLASVNGAAQEFRRTSGRIATVAERLGTDATAALTDLRAVVGDTQRTVAQATRAVDTLQAEASRMVRRVDASATQFDDQLLVAVTDLRGSLEAIQRSLDRFNDPRAALLGPERSRLGPGEKLP